MPGRAKSRISDMVNNGWVEPPAPPTDPSAAPSSGPGDGAASESQERLPDGAASASQERLPDGGASASQERLPDGVPTEEAPTRLGRGQERSPRDMTLSLVVLLVPIALLLIFYRVVLSGDAPVTVDPAPTI